MNYDINTNTFPAMNDLKIDCAFRNAKSASDHYSMLIQELQEKGVLGPTQLNKFNKIAEKIEDFEQKRKRNRFDLQRMIQIDD